MNCRMIISYHNIILTGGLGSQIIRFLSGIGRAIKNGVNPSRIKIIRCLYKNSGEDIKWFYHNSEDLSDYISLNPQINYKIYKDRNNFKADKFNQETLDYIKIALGSEISFFYYNLKEDFYSNMFREEYKNVVWVRGKERKSNIDYIYNFLQKKQFNTSHKTTVLTNDKEFISKSKLSEYEISGGQPKEDFKILINAEKIITQLSGFSITPFMLSKYPQEIVISSKDSHIKDQYPHLDADWEFFINLCGIMNNINPEKKYKVEIN